MSYTEQRMYPHEYLDHIERKERIIAEARFEIVESNGKYLIYDKERHRYVSENNLPMNEDYLVFDSIISNIDKIQTTMHAVVTIDGEHGLISCADNQWITPTIYDFIELEGETWNKSYNSIPVVYEDKYGLVNYSNETIVPCLYDTIGNYDILSGNRLCIKFDGKSEYLDNYGNVVLQSGFKLDTHFKDGMLWVKDIHSNLHCLYDSDGILVMSEELDDVKPFINGVSVVKKNGLHGVLDKNGTYLLEPQFTYMHDFIHGVVLVCLDGKWGYLENDGTYLIEPMFDEADDMKMDCRQTTTATIDGIEYWVAIDGNYGEII